MSDLPLAIRDILRAADLSPDATNVKSITLDTSWITITVVEQIHERGSTEYLAKRLVRESTTTTRVPIENLYRIEPM